MTDLRILEWKSCSYPYSELWNRSHVEKLNECDHLKTFKKEVVEFISQLDVKFILEDNSLLEGHSLNIYIPDKKVAIECDSIYWNSSCSRDDDAYSKSRHIDKTIDCEKKGVQLLHIFHNEWDEKKDIWKSVILHKLQKTEHKIYARKCVFGNVAFPVAKQFCIDNHLQGSTNFSFAHGLYLNHELVMIATFGKSRYNKDIPLELIRMCSRLNTSVIGGASKLTKNLSYISYGNRRWCSALSNVYDSISEYSHPSDPCYWYIRNGKLNHRSVFMKHKLKGILREFDPSMTEVQNCYNNGYRRIWDAGNLVFIKHSVRTACK